MLSPHERAKETQELIQRFQNAAARRRRRRFILGSAGAVTIVALVVAIIVFTRPGASETAVADTTTTTAATPVIEASVTSSTVPSTVPSTTTSQDVATTTTVASSTTVTQSYVVVIDPGHQAKANSEQEPIGPGSSKTKDKVSSGTRSVNTGTPESRLVLAVALRLRDSLEAQGIQVIMTRTTEDVNISNRERAQLANDVGADLFVRIHADGATDSTVNGVLMLYPANIAGWTDDIASESKRAAQLALEALVATTGARERGLVARSDIAGFNWSDVPVILPEIGLMTNPAEDALLATDEYQGKIVQGLTTAILEYLGVR